MEKKYQIFISSTYEDLKKERARAIETILQLNHIPLGMEAFTATDMKQMKLIEKAIDSSDYYILIIGTRYGSIYNQGVSFTEAEYDYAKSKGKPVLTFIREGNRFNPNEHADLQKKLITFKEKLKRQEKTVKFWRNGDHLSVQIAASLARETQNNPQKGWIRYNHVYENCSETIEFLPYLGIKKLHRPCYNMPFTEESFKNVKTIKLLFISGWTFLKRHGDKLVQALEKGIAIQVIIATMDSDYVKEAMAMEIKDSQFVLNDIASNIQKAENVLKNLRLRTSKGKILLGRCNTQLRGNMVIVDDKFAFYTPILQPMHSSEILTLELTEGKILDDCKRHFDTLYKILDNEGKVEEITYEKITYEKITYNHKLSSDSSSREVSQPMERAEVFISYTKKDKPYLDELLKFLKTPESEYGITIWYDKMISTGDNWKREIRDHMSKAKVTILMVSQDFLVSPFVRNEELPRLLQDAEDEHAKIMWIPVGVSQVEDTRIKGKDSNGDDIDICIADYQAVGDKSQTLHDMTENDRNKLYKKLCKDIKECFGITS